MPSWKIHAKIGNEISKYLKVNKKYFMIGNLLPDQDKYNIPTISKNVPRNLTHFIFLKDYRIGINLPDYEKMYQKYKDDFNNPVLLGYLVHLLSDYYWNKYIYDNYFVKENDQYIGVIKADKTFFKCDFKTANTMKQADFQKYNNFITVRKNNFRFCLNSKYFKQIDELRLNKKDIYTVGKYLDLSHCRIADDSLYQILNENVLDEIFENSIAFIIQYLQAKKIIKNKY